jgi:DNA (cytosine-5)-methyltransferase 1
MAMKIRVGTVCSGIDAPIVALKSMGINFEHVYSCEIDDACVSVINKKFNPNNLYRDMWDLSRMKEIPECDILIAGLPCQAFSNIGQQRGLEDKRGVLFRSLTEIMRKSKPKYVVFENVRNMLKHDNGNSFKAIRDAFAEVGYSLKYKLMKTSDYGLPQGRTRIYAICYRTDDQDGINYEFPTPRELQVSLGEILGGETDRKLAFTLRVGGRHSPINDRHNWDGYIVDGKEMRIGPRHASMLQGFPADFYDDIDISESAAMKQMGNTMSVPVVGMVLANLLFAGKNMMEVAT